MKTAFNNIIQAYKDAFAALPHRLKAINIARLLASIGWNLILTIACALFVCFRKEQGELFMTIFIPLFLATSLILFFASLMKAPPASGILYSLLITVGCSLQIFMLVPENNGLNAVYRYIFLIYFAIGIGLAALPALRLIAKMKNRKTVRFILLALVVISFLAVLLFGKEIRGAKAWISLFGFDFQMTEISRLLSLLLLSACIGDQSLSPKKRFLWSLGIFMLNGFFFMALSELGTFISYAITHFASRLLFAPKKRWVLAEGGAAALLLTLALFGLFFVHQALPADSRLGGVWPKVERRFDIFIGADGLDAGATYQSDTAKKYLSLGSFLGSPEGTIAIPEVGNDYIFIYLLLRLGVLGAGFILLDFALLLASIFTTAGSQKKPSQEIPIACTFILAMVIQVVICVMCNFHLLPIMGIPFPFLSAGGSALGANLIMALFTIYFMREKRKELNHAK